MQPISDNFCILSILPCDYILDLATTCAPSIALSSTCTPSDTLAVTAAACSINSAPISDCTATATTTTAITTHGAQALGLFQQPAALFSMELSNALPSAQLFANGLAAQRNMMPSPADIIMSAAKVFNSPISPSLLIQNGLDLKKLQSSASDTTECSPSNSKNEPNSSSNSQPGTPRVYDKRTVPACAICGSDSTGIHFGVDACAACSAFFRRTVVLNKEYGCSRDGNCAVTKDGAGGQKCRACRFTKCLRAGMDKNSVQHRRDAIGKYSVGVKREYSPSPGDPQSMSPKSPKSLKECVGPSVLEEFIESQRTLDDRRKVFYTCNEMEALLDYDHPEHQKVRELTNIKECIHDLWKTEPQLAAIFVKENKYLAQINAREQAKILKNFIIVRQAIEEPYLTWKYGGLDKQWWVMTNRVYIDCNNPEKYFLNGSMDGLNLDVMTAKNLFLPSFTHAMSSVGELMRKIDISHIEMVSLLALLLLDPATPSIMNETRKTLASLREQVIKDMFNYYEADDSSEEPEVRLGNLIMIVSAIKIHAIRTAENMHMLHIFNIVPNNPLFGKMASTPNIVIPEQYTDDVAATDIATADAEAQATQVKPERKSN